LSASWVPLEATIAASKTHDKKKRFESDFGSQRILGWSWGLLGAFWEVLGASWAILNSWGGLGASWAALGSLLGQLETMQNDIQKDYHFSRPKWGPPSLSLRGFWAPPIEYKWHPERVKNQEDFQEQKSCSSTVLEPSWVHVGAFLGASCGPKWPFRVEKHNIW